MRALSEEEFSSFLPVADVRRGTPVPDGTDRVAKEFVTSQTDGDGTRPWSELTGAASQLQGVIMVNPFYFGAVGRRSPEASPVEEPQRRARMRLLRSGVFGFGTPGGADSRLFPFDGSVPDEEQPSDTLDPR